MSTPSASASMSNAYDPAGVPEGTVAVRSNVCVLGAGTGPTDAGVNAIQLAAAGAGEADATVRCTSATVENASVESGPIWSPRLPPASTAWPPVKPAAASDW